MVSRSGVMYSEVKFQPIVTGEPEAILKKALLVVAGWVKVSPPAAAVWGMEMKLPVAELDCDIVDGAFELFVGQRAKGKRERTVRGAKGEGNVDNGGRLAVVCANGYNKQIRI